MLPRLLAVVSPVIPVAAFITLTGMLEPVDAALPTPATGHTARLLQALTPDAQVVIVGNSQADSAVDPKGLGDALGLQGEVVSATLPGLHAEGAYVILKYRVFGAGMTPKIVVLPMSLDHLLDTHPPPDHHLPNLQENVPGSDPVIDAKVYGSADAGWTAAWPRWNRAVGNAQVGRDRAFELLTSLPLRALGVDDPDARMDAARDAALGKVAGANLALQVRVMPAAGGGDDRPAAPLVRSVEDTLLPEIVAMVAEHGARLVVATVPQNMQALGTRPETARQVAEWLQARDIPFLHLESMEVPSDAWLDPGHLAAKGKGIYTTLLADKLREIGALSPGAMRLPDLPIEPPKVSRAGDPAPPQILGQTASADGCLIKLRVDAPRWRSDAFLARVGLGHASLLTATADGREIAPHLSVNEQTGCLGRMWHAADTLAVAPPRAGAALAVAWAGVPSTRRAAPRDDQPLDDTIYWLPPGASLRLDWGSPPEADHLAVALVEINPGKAPPTLTVAGRAAPMVGWDHTWAADVPVSPGDLGQPVVLMSPPDGPDLLLRLVGVSREGRTQLALGKPDDMPWRLEVSGSLTMDASAPVPIQVVGSPPTRAGKALMFEVDGPLAEVTNDALIAAVGDKRFGACLPLAVRKVGDTSAGETKGVQQTRPGRVTAMIPPESGDDWELVWREKRVCTRRAWVMPGETTPIRPRVPGAVFVTTHDLHLDVVAFPPRGAAHVRLLLGDAEVLDADVDLAGPRLVTLPLDRPVPPWPDALRMEVTAPPGVFVSVGHGELRPREASAWYLAAGSQAAEEDGE